MRSGWRAPDKPWSGWRRDRRRGRVCWSARNVPGDCECGTEAARAGADGRCELIDHRKGPEMRPIWILCVLLMATTTGGAVAAELAKSSAWKATPAKQKPVSRHPHASQYLFGDRRVERSLGFKPSRNRRILPVYESGDRDGPAHSTSTSALAIAQRHWSSVSTATGRDARELCSRPGLGSHQSAAGGAR